MARPTYTDLILFKVPQSGTEGFSQTALNNIITLLFKDAFRIFFPGEYDTYSVSVDHPNIDTTDVYGVIIRRATYLGNAWLNKSKGEEEDLPLFKLTEEDINDISDAINKPTISYDFSDRQEDFENGIYGGSI
jgi:hypothetical protein